MRIGDKPGGQKYQSDNFWQMADTGPCGPCSEIFYDHGAGVEGGPPGSPEADGDRYIEIWNLVFMQFNRDEKGVMHPLPKPSVDTGMGLERIAAVLQGKHSNYEIDLFQDLIKAAARETKQKQLKNPSLNVIADHIRACGFLIVDGVIPGNEGRGYVLRRIVRRAIRHGYKLGQKQPFFHRLVADLDKAMGDAYPELQKSQGPGRGRAEAGRRALRRDAGKRHGRARGGARLGREAARRRDRVPPLRHLRLPGGPHGGHRARARRAHRHGGLRGGDGPAARARAGRVASSCTARDLEYSGGKTEFRGYDTLSLPAKVVALYREGTQAQALKAAIPAPWCSTSTPFYAEAGGQVGDRGELVGSGGTFEVADTQKIQAEVYGHQGTLKTGTLKVGDRVEARVDAALRARTMRNHSVTHLMHKALREVLGPHVQQKGSLVDAEKTRFDFSHDKAMSEEQIREVEARVNAEILQNSADARPGDADRGGEEDQAR